MSSLTLQSCKLRESRLVPDKEVEPETLDFVEACDRLAPSGSPGALLQLRNLKLGNFVGVRKVGGHPRTFTINLPNGNIREILRAHPTFGSDLIEVYRVERAEWDAQITEPVEAAAR